MEKLNKLCLHCHEVRECHEFILDFSHGDLRRLYLCDPCLRGLRRLPPPHNSVPRYGAYWHDYLEPIPK